MATMLGLSRERAGQVAEHLQGALSFASPRPSRTTWAGDTDPGRQQPETEEGRAQNRRVEVEVWYDEMGKEVWRSKKLLVPHEIKHGEGLPHGDRLQTALRGRPCETGARAEPGRAAFASRRGHPGQRRSLSKTYVAGATTNLEDKDNVVVKFVGYSDDAPLSGRNRTHLRRTPWACRKRARDEWRCRCRTALGLPSAAIESRTVNGASRPHRQQCNGHGRALNRRVEVEFWYDDPLQDLPDEPQMCPEDFGAEIVTRDLRRAMGRDSPSIEFVDGEPVIPANYTALLRRGS